MGKINLIKLMIGVAVMLLFPGCASTGLKIHNSMTTKASTPFYLAYDSEEIIRDQSRVATITSSNGLEIDGVDVTKKTMRSANSGGFLTSQIVVADVIPGTYKIRVRFTPDGTPVRMEPITFTFEAGRIYSVGIVLFKVVIKENTFDDVTQKIAANRNNAVFEKKNK